LLLCVFGAVNIRTPRGTPKTFTELGLEGTNDTLVYGRASVIITIISVILCVPDGWIRGRGKMPV